MSNRIDYYGGGVDCLSVPAAKLTVFIDGRVSCFFDVVEIVASTGPEYGSASFRFDNAAYQKMSKKISGRTPSLGQCVEVFEVYDSGQGTVAVSKRRIFIGQITGVQVSESGDEDLLEISARDCSAKMENVIISGRRFDNGQFVETESLIFNEDSNGNAAVEKLTRDGKKSTVFSAASGVYWTCAAAVEYLLSEYVNLSELSVSESELIEAVMNGVVCDELDVDGDSLLEALEKVCRIAGVSFKFVPCSNYSKSRISFYRPGDSRSVELDIQRKGQKLDLSKTQIASVKRSGSFWPVTHRYFAQGEKKVFESTFELVGAWDPSLEGRGLYEYETSHDDFLEVEDVYRKWCLNETGEYSSAPYNSGDMFDFFNVDSQAFVPGLPRKFENSISTDQDGKNYGIHVEVSYDSGSTWTEFTGSFDNLSDECGIRITQSSFDTSFYLAADWGRLRLRVTAAVQSDLRLSCSVADGPVGSIIEVCDHHIKTNGVYEYRKVCGGSIFNYADAGVDDSEKLLGDLRNSVEHIVNVIETIDLETPFLRTTVFVGDRVVSSPDGRDVIGTFSDRRSVFWVDRVVMDYEKQTTRMRVLRKRQFDI